MAAEGDIITFDMGTGKKIVFSANFVGPLEKRSVALRGGKNLLTKENIPVLFKAVETEGSNVFWESPAVDRVLVA